MYCNAHMGPREIKAFCPLTPDAQQLLKCALKELVLSARAYHKILKVARTIRDMKETQEKRSGGTVPIEHDDISEALQYRHFDNQQL